VDTPSFVDNTRTSLILVPSDGRIPALTPAALHLLARARTLTFHGFNLSLRFRYVPTPTYRLPRLLGAAALERIQQGDGDASLNLVADLLATLRINEATNRAAPYRPSILDQAAVIISLTVRHAPPSEAALRSLAAALVATAPDDHLGPYFLSDRARFIDEVRGHLRGGPPLTDANPVVAFLVQPWLRSRVNRNLALFGRLVAATEQPWPERLAAVDAVVEQAARRTVRSGRLGALGGVERSFAAGYFPLITRYVAHRLAVTAVLRAVTAVELYRIERGTPPERLDDLGAVSGVRDPMSRDTLRYRRDTGGYVVYSVASDGTDDGGDFGALSPYSVWWQVAPDQSPDWGIRIRLPVEGGAL
ncbi:MAG: hypothetical protein IH939_19805, partial [Acidobacteria bacterium]|nr:hypothetical protein [Acidobacteriota bacterium]